MRLVSAPIVATKCWFGGFRGRLGAPIPRATGEDEFISGGTDGPFAESVQRQLANTITRIRDAEDDVSQATLLSLAMALSLEAEIASDTYVSSVSKATWTLQSIRGMADQARQLFTAGVREDKDDENGDLYTHEELVGLYPTKMIEAINQVIFEYQGYRKMKAWSDVDAFSFARVVEKGNGAPLYVAILYQTVAKEAGLHLDIQVLEDGQYAVLSMEGQWAIDPYSSGLIMAKEEVAELFDVEPKASSLREVSVALVKTQLFVDWAAITGVFLEGEEALDLALGLFDDVSFSYGTGSDDDEEEDISQFFVVDDEQGQRHLANCVKAAEKLRVLELDSSASKIRHGVLLYFNKRYAEAAEVLEQVSSAGRNETDLADEVQDRDQVGNEGEHGEEGGDEDEDERIMNKCHTMAKKCRLLSSL